MQVNITAPLITPSGPPKMTCQLLPCLTSAGGVPSVAAGEIVQIISTTTTKRRMLLLSHCPTQSLFFRRLSSVSEVWIANLNRPGLQRRVKWFLLGRNKAEAGGVSNWNRFLEGPIQSIPVFDRVVVSPLETSQIEQWPGEEFGDVKFLLSCLLHYIRILRIGKEH